MTFTNFPQESEKDRTVECWHFGGNLHHKTIQPFTVRKWWQTLISFLKFMTFGLFFLIGVSGTLASFPWDDSTVLQRLTRTLRFTTHLRHHMDLCCLYCDLDRPLQTEG
jgi:hypothetical protein